MTTKNKNEKKETVKFDFRTIKTFEDACKANRITTMLPDLSLLMDADLRKPIVAAYKLMVIYKAINNSWRPDWSDDDQKKWFPWFGFLSSGSGFSFSDSGYFCTHATVGSRLCTDSSEKARYIAEQFEAEYVDYFLYSE